MKVCFFRRGRCSVMYCLYKVPTVILDGYNWLWPFVNQNMSYLKAGDKIEITPGVGSFSRAAQPKIVINGKKIELNDMAVAITKIKVSDKPGKHFIPVQITYTDQGGRQQTISKDVEYMVVAGPIEKQ
jgi:hypothetical protein